MYFGYPHMYSVSLNRIASSVESIAKYTNSRAQTMIPGDQEKNAFGIQMSQPRFDLTNTKQELPHFATSPTHLKPVCIMCEGQVLIIPLAASVMVTIM